MTFDELQTNLNIHFKDEKLMHAAFVHRSYLNEVKEQRESNERLEFLGDAILSFLSSDYLYKKYPEYPEGTLTNIRSGLVKTKSLSETSKELGLGELLFLSRGEEDSGGRNNASLLADTFEALLGALYLDQGIEAARVFLERVLFPKVTNIVENKTYIDFKSLLQEIVQEESRISPTYNVIKTEGPDHAKTFWVEVLVGNTVLGQGMGKSKQEAQQAAAAQALEKRGKK